MEEQQVISLLIKLNKNLKKIRKELRSRHQPAGADDNPDNWCLIEYVLKETGVSRTSVYRYRRQGLLRYKKVAGIVTYYLPDVLNLKRRCMK